MRIWNRVLKLVAFWLLYSQRFGREGKRRQKQKSARIKNGDVSKHLKTLTKSEVFLVFSGWW
jgi:cell division protein FtsB